MNEPRMVKKTSITDKVIIKQKKFLIIAIFCVVTLLISSSYALLTNFDKTDEVITFKTGNLNMSVNNTLITLNGNLPENNTNGLQNATPITLTLTNTGTMFIEGYDVKLVSDSTKTSTLNEDYIKYAISEDGINYLTPSILTSNENIIFSGYDLEVDQSKTIYLKVWIDETGGNQALNKEYYGSIKIDLYQKKEKPLLLNVFKEELLTRTNSYILEDDTYYVSGDADDNDTSTTDDIDFNYVWYSGKLWRITAINPDGTMKMITEDLMTSIGWGEKPIVSDTDPTSAYSTSWMRQWLNQEFLPTLYNYENIIDVDAGWYSITTGDKTAKPTGEYTLTEPVGLLNLYEYEISKNGYSPYGGYLDGKFFWMLINPAGIDGVNTVLPLGHWAAYPSSASFAVRPVINLKSTIELLGGIGTASNPYRINVNQKDAKLNVTLINTRSSGEYVKLENDETNQMFRIVDTELVGENLTTKLVLNDYVKDTNDVDTDGDTTEVLTKSFSSSNSHILWSDVDKTDTTYWRGYLNNTWIKEIDNTYNETDGVSSILEKGTYYLGMFNNLESYKNAVCSTVSSDVSVGECIANGTIVANTSNEDYVGLLRVGEISFYQRENSYDNWLITPYDESGVYSSKYGATDPGDPSADSYGARPTINLKSTLVIKSGSGTKQDPFVVGLPS